MTQALNLANFANKLNSSGQTDNTGLQNSSVTVTTGTGMSGGGAVALGSSITLTNAGVTSLTAGSGISLSASTGGVTISASGGGVTSLNGQTGAITNTAINSIGSYAGGAIPQNNHSAGSTVAGSSLRQANNSSVGGNTSPFVSFSNGEGVTNVGLSGTWRAMGASSWFNYGCGSWRTDSNIWVRIS